MLFNDVRPSQNIFYLVVLGLMVAVISSALAFEHIGGYLPCKLCLEQRQPWYIGIPIMLFATISVYSKWPAWFSRGLILIAGIVMFYSLYLGVHHAGVEWGWWMGPGDCGAVEGGLATTTTDFLKQLEETTPPSCDEAALRIFGLSFAGWNAIASLAGALLAIRTAFAK